MVHENKRLQIPVNLSFNYFFVCLFFLNQDWLFCLIFVLSEDSISDKTSVTQVIPFQARNYYKSVSENKEITKLLSVLSSSISSSKKVLALRSFTKFVYCSLRFSSLRIWSFNAIIWTFEQEVMAALQSFNSYHHIWRKDREEAMRQYGMLSGWYFHVSECAVLRVCSSLLFQIYPR